MGDGRRLFRRRQGETECRSAPRLRFHPDSAAMPLDGLPAERKPKSVTGVFSPVQALESSEYAVPECRIYARAVVLDGEHQFDIHRPGGNVNGGRRLIAVLDSISNQMAQNHGQYFEVPHDGGQRVMSNDGVPPGDLLVRAEKRMAQYRFHISPKGLPVASIRGPIVHQAGKQRLHFRRALLDTIEECAGFGIEATVAGLRQQLTE